LISATKPGMTASFTYDGDGNRVEKNVNGTVTRYMVDGNNLTGYAQVVEELGGDNSVQVVYTYGLDLISQNRKGFLSWSKSYYGYDATGTTRMLFDDSGTVTDTYTYEAFGTIINRTGTTTNAYLFHGEQFDADLGLYYLRARYMDNTIGRFTTMDGFEGNNEDPHSLHKYGFANNNSINYTDMSGNMVMLAICTMALLGILSSFSQARAAKVLNKWMRYSGTQLSVYEGNPGDDRKPLALYNATSGLLDEETGEDFRFALFQDKKDRGPIPTGKYEVNLLPDPNRIANFDHSTGDLVASPEGGIELIPISAKTNDGQTWVYQEHWGTKRASLTPLKGTKLFGRSSFYLHNSHKGYTHGCIETENGVFDDLLSYKKGGHASIQVWVNYTSEITYGGTKY